MKKLLTSILNWIRARWAKASTPHKGTCTMAAIDPTGFAALIDILAADIQKISAELSGATATQAALDAEKAAHAADRAALDQANADLAASQASVTDLEGKLKAQTDALAALLPPAA